MPGDDELFGALAASPRPPSDPDLFSSNTLFGEPGIYPQGSPMQPATGPPPSEAAALQALGELGVHDASERIRDPGLVARAPDVGARAALLALTNTVGEPLLTVFAAGRTPVASLRYGEPTSPGRIVGPSAADDTGHRVLNARYQGEHPALFAGSLAHDLLWNPDGAGQYEEATLHALCAMVHVQLLAKVPELAHAGTELARRQNSLAITLLNSRHPGSADVALIAPDGPGTIPGGAPGMQTPDFWSIPFVGGPASASDAPPLLAEVLALLAPGVDPPDALRFDDALGAWLATHLGRESLPAPAQARAAIALGMIDPSVLGSV